MHDFFNRDILGYYLNNQPNLSTYEPWAFRGLELREVNADAKSIYFKHSTSSLPFAAIMLHALDKILIESNNFSDIPRCPFGDRCLVSSKA